MKQIIEAPEVTAANKLDKKLSNEFKLFQAKLELKQTPFDLCIGQNLSIKISNN